MYSYIANKDSPQTQGVLSEIQQVVRKIFVGNFNQTGTLAMRPLVRAKGGVTIFIEYDLGMGQLLAPIYRLLLDMALKEALSRHASEGNVWLVVDEFRLIPHLSHIDNAVNFGRSFGVKLIGAVQNVEQVYHAYGEFLGRSILSGFSTTLAFRLTDSPSRRYVKDLFGQNRKKEAYTSDIDERGVVESVHDASVVEDWDIARLGLSEAIVGLPGEEPFVFTFGKYSGPS
jgi:type IV secretory pathway TraG/TraD family ATPase VirD4